MKIFKYLLLCFALLFASCSTNQVNTQNSIKMDSHVKFNKDSLKWLNVDFVNYITRDDGLIEFQAIFTNTSSSNKLLSYKINWKDENGFIQKTIMSKWTKTLIESGRNLSIRGISPSIKSKDFEIILQETTKDDEKRNDSYHKQYSH